MSTWTDLPAMAKIEVVVDGDDVPAVRDLFLDAGATGYTAVSGVSGFGHGGHHQGHGDKQPGEQTGAAPDSFLESTKNKSVNT